MVVSRNTGINQKRKTTEDVLTNWELPKPPHQNRSGLSSLHVPAGDTQPYPTGPDPKTWTGPWTTLTDSSQIAQHVCAANRRQYNQAASTPFATEPLKSYIGQDASSEGSVAILSGITPPIEILSSLQPETASLLRTLVQPTPTPKNVSINITPEAYRSCYKAIPKRTSSSPSGQHVGYYKAAIHNDSITLLHCMMMSIPFQAGFSPLGGKKSSMSCLKSNLGVPESIACALLHFLKTILIKRSASSSLGN
jgi:hypothetical protein